MQLLKNRQHREVVLTEKYGTGIQRIFCGFLNYGLLAPRFEQIGEMFRVATYTRAELPAGKNITGEVRHEIIRIAKICITPKNRKELMAELGLKHQDHFRETYLLPALETGMIE